MIVTPPNITISIVAKMITTITTTYIVELATAEMRDHSMKHIVGEEEFSK